MWELLQMNSNQFLRGWYYTDWFKNPTQKLFFKYEIINPKSRGISQIAQNLFLEGAEILIKSNYQLDWKMKSVVQLQDENFYTILNVDDDPTEINPQCLRYLKHNPSTSYYISLKLRVNQ